MLSYLHATYRWPFVSRSGTAMAHTASATTTQHLQGAAIPLPADTKKMRIKSLKFLAAKCSTHSGSFIQGGCLFIQSHVVPP